MSTSGDPILLVGSCCTSTPEISSVLKDLLNVEDLPTASHPSEDLDEYPWTIENKYYRASVRVQCVAGFPAAVTPSVTDSPVEALLITFDALQASSWESARQWSDFAEERNLDIRLLLCDQLPSSNTPTAVDDSQRDVHAVLDRETAVQWCIKNGFELVEMRPLDDGSDDEDDFGRELTGVQRCVQVLNAHEWTNLIMKEQDPLGRQPRSPRQDDSGAMAEMQASTSNDVSSLEDLEKIHDQKAEENRARLQPSAAAAAAAAAMSAVGAENGTGSSQFPYAPVPTSDGQEEDAFGKLFEQFGAMKTEASSLDPTERKAYAEKVVMSFWEAMGGDGDELEGLDDSDAEGAPAKRS